LDAAIANAPAKRHITRLIIVMIGFNIPKTKQGTTCLVSKFFASVRVKGLLDKVYIVLLKGRYPAYIAEFNAINKTSKEAERAQVGILI